MKAAWINEFRQELLTLKEEQPSVSTVALHQIVGGRWVLDDGVSLPESLLDKPPPIDGYSKVGKQKRYLFPVHEAGVIVDAFFSIFPKSGTLRQVRYAIDKRRDDSQHRFDAHHDSLTSCKNRKSFDKAMRAAFESMTSKGNGSSGILSGGGVRSISLVTLDIDYFKRINDSRGHDYGDVVLRAFAWLLDDLCRDACVDFPGVSFALFRLGGEEFNVLIVGELEERDLLTWVESVRLAIERAYIPSTSQIETMERDAGAAIAAPIEGERRVTASLGVARIVGMVRSDAIGTLSSRLKMQADKALYSAKNSGRNRLRYFPDILKRYGRVIENDRTAGTIIIDIGSEVGVVTGGEFFVIPEKYTGDVHYVADDGRSQRKLGTYPRVKIAKVVAFNVQSEISFCSVSEHRDHTEIGVGCLLESIPLGLFGGLSTPYGNASPLGDLDARKLLVSRFTNLPEDSARMLAVRVDAIREIEKAHGQVKANELLAAVHAAMTRILPAPVKVVQTEVGQFGAVFSVDDTRMNELLKQLLTSMRTVCADVADFCVGVFDGSSRASVGDKYSLDNAFAFDYAVIASAAAAKNSKAHFEIESPRLVIEAMRNSGLDDQAIADYNKFRDIGISSSALDNLAGVVYFGLGRMEDAASAFRISLDASGDAVTRGNYGIALFFLNRFSEAFRHLTQSFEEGNEIDISGLYAIAAFESHIREGVPSSQTVDELFLKASAAQHHAFVKEERLKSAHARWAALNPAS